MTRAHSVLTVIIHELESHRPISHTKRDIMIRAVKCTRAVVGSVSPRTVSDGEEWRGEGASRRRTFIVGLPCGTSLGFEQRGLPAGPIVPPPRGRTAPIWIPSSPGPSHTGSDIFRTPPRAWHVPSVAACGLSTRSPPPR